MILFFFHCIQQGHRSKYFNSIRTCENLNSLLNIWTFNHVHNYSVDRSICAPTASIVLRSIKVGYNSLRCCLECNKVKRKKKMKIKNHETFYPLTRVQRGHNESDFESTTSSIALISLRHFSLASSFAGVGIHAAHQRWKLSDNFCTAMISELKSQLPFA